MYVVMDKQKKKTVLGTSLVERRAALYDSTSQRIVINSSEDSIEVNDPICVQYQHSTGTCASMCVSSHVLIDSKRA